MLSFALLPVPVSEQFILKFVVKKFYGWSQWSNFLRQLSLPIWFTLPNGISILFCLPRGSKSNWNCQQQGASNSRNHTGKAIRSWRRGICVGVCTHVSFFFVCVCVCTCLSMCVWADCRNRALVKIPPSPTG